MATKVEEVRAWLDAQEKLMTPREVGSVSVDSGCVEFSFGPDLKKCGPLMRRVGVLSCETARVAYDGRSGALRTAWGDGLVKVMHQAKGLQQGKGWTFAANIMPPEGATHLFLGDCGRADVRIEFEEPPLFVRFYWNDETLWVG